MYYLYFISSFSEGEFKDFQMKERKGKSELSEVSIQCVASLQPQVNKWSLIAKNYNLFLIHTWPDTLWLLAVFDRNAIYPITIHYL